MPREVIETAMRALIVGLGSVGRRHARNWAALAPQLGLGELLVCRQANRPLPEPLDVEFREFFDMDAALAARPDVVLVTNPTNLHVVTAQRAVECGAHVLVEKPLGHALDGVADLLATAETSGKVLTVGYNLRFHPSLQRLRSLLRSGAIGRPLSVRAEMGEYLPDWHPWEDYRSGYAAQRAMGGGPVLTFSHELDALCWLFGAPRAVTAVAHRSGLLEVDTEDVAEMVLEFEDGPLVSIHMDYLRRPPRRFIEVVGEDGVLRWEFNANRLLWYVPATREWRVEEGDPRFERNVMFVNELQDFVEQVRGRNPSFVNDFHDFVDNESDGSRDASAAPGGHGAAAATGEPGTSAAIGTAATGTAATGNAATRFSATTGEHDPPAAPGKPGTSAAPGSAATGEHGKAAARASAATRGLAATGEPGNAAARSIAATGEQGAAVLAIALAALRSAAEGVRVDFACEPEAVKKWLKTLTETLTTP